MSDGARCHYCRKVPCVCDSIPRPTRADAEFLATDPCEPLQNLAQGYLALLDENEALQRDKELYRELYLAANSIKATHTILNFDPSVKEIERLIRAVEAIDVAREGK